VLKKIRKQRTVAVYWLTLLTALVWQSQKDAVHQAMVMSPPACNWKHMRLRNCVIVFS
jgi:hypothetical protein